MQSQPIDRLLELISIGAGHAAGAFADVVGRTFWMRVPQVRKLDSPSTSVPRRRRATAVLFEVDGALQGVVALVLPADAAAALVRRLVGPEESVSRELGESAIRELGNIVVSHVCSAIADTTGARLVPSLPVLVQGDGEAALLEHAARRGAARLLVETEIADEEGELHGRLVFIPDC